MAQAISNLLTPAQSALNSRIGAGLSINSSGGVQGGYVNPSNATTANLLLGPMASKTPVSPTAPVVNGGTTSTAPTGAQNQNVPAGPGTAGYTYTNGVLTSVGGQPTNQAPASSLVNSSINAPVAPVAPVSTNTTSPATFSGLVGQTALAGQNAASTGSSQEAQAYNEAQALQSQLAGSQSNEANTLANMQGNPIPLEFQQGRGNIVQGLYQAQQNALSSQLQGESNLAGQGTAVQGQGLTALGNAAGLAAPQLGSIGQVPYSPLDLSQGSVLGSTQPGGVAAAGNLLGQLQGAQAQGAAPGQAAASNISTSGTAATSAAASGLQTATQNYVTANTAYSAAQNQAANLQQVLTSTGINSNPQFVNQRINQLQNQLGSANYTSFITALTEMQQKYTTLLSTVGAQTPTVNGQQATDILNPNSTPAQINAAISALNNAAYAQLKPLYDQIGTYSSQLSGSNTNSNANSTTANPWK